MSYIGIGSPIPDLSSLPGQTGGEVEVTLDYPSSSACGDASPFSPSEATPPGGVFSSSPAGLNLNTSTGEVTPVGSTPQTYTISYTVSGIISQFALTINAVQQSTFSYSSSSFQQIGTATPTLAGGTTLGGSFSAPAGVSINTSTGVIDLAASTIGGPYTITYTTPGPCASASTFTLSITAVAVELIDNNFAMEFDAASSQYINVDSFSALNSATTVTVSAWFKSSTYSTLGRVLSNQAIEIYQADSSYSNTQGRFYYRLRGNFGNQFALLGGTSASGVGNLVDGNWHHLCITFDNSTTTATVYEDSVPVLTDTSVSGTLNSVASNLYIGSSGTSTNFIDGDIDEVAIWNKALELADIQRIYNATNDNPGKCANLFTAGLGTDLVLWNRMGD